ncbi:hypothetical protein [Ornithinimicrobium faecis]|uniref:Glycosyltransferase family 2 protein n=1 Tax=Ornithinimicrobium faecis TaxID=2934158 RepID=A0ABY4YT74_9MICO|nr:MULTISPECIES: hypothetical protein [unclassified Ornithinimicrobium]USQ79976.1 hypothetical protein NF556_20710 [Ornithinimicrobium sp. HY1793]
MTRLRTALITTVRRQHDEVLDQVSGFSLGAEVPEFHVVVALADRTVSQGQLPITSDRWTTLIAGLPTVRQQLPTARGLQLGVERAVEAGAELLVLIDVTCIPGPRFLEQLHDHLATADQEGPTPSGSTPSGPTPAGPTLWAPMVQRLRPAPPEGYEFTRLEEWVRAAERHPVLPLRPELGDAVVDPDQFSSPVLAISTADLESVGGLCPDYVGGLGHDTDLAAAVTDAGGSVRLVPGATAYRQHQDTDEPDEAHLASATTDAQLFRERWGRWPQAPWLTELTEAGLVTLPEEPQPSNRND